MRDMVDFQWGLSKAGVKYFNAREMFVKGGAHQVNGLNTDPPRRLWTKGVEVALVADELRRRCRFPITISSAYRSPRYNATLPGAAPHSMHLQFNALDLKPQDRTSSKLRMMKRIIQEMRNDGFFMGGIGSYRTFLHIDARGHNATWGNWTN